MWKKDDIERELMGIISQKSREISDLTRELDIYKCKGLSELVTEQLMGINVKIGVDGVSHYMAGLKEDDREKMIKSVHRTLGSMHLKKIMDYICEKQIEFSITQAKNMEQVNFGRATINGIYLLYNELLSIDKLHNIKQKGEDFDKHRVI